jgi:hypothetical protein
VKPPGEKLARQDLKACMVHRSWALEAHVADLGQFLKCPENAAECAIGPHRAAGFRTIERL